jgi:hypothetical protein
MEIKKIISLFPCLNDLRFEPWTGYIGNGDFPEDIEMVHKMAFVKDWELACRKLNSVTFMDGSRLERRGEVWRHYN